MAKMMAPEATTMFRSGTSASMGIRFILNQQVYGWELIDQSQGSKNSIGAFHVKLSAHNPGDFHRFAVGHRLAFFVARRGGVTGSGLDVGNFADAICRDGGDNGGGLSDQILDAPLARTFGLAEQGVQQPQDEEGNE